MATHVAEARSRARGTGWAWFAGWALAGALLVAGLVGSFGLLVVLMPVAAAMTGVLVWRSRLWPEASGAGAGIAALMLFVAYANRSYAPCPVEPSTVTRIPGYQPPVCGGIEPLPWLILGILVLVASVGTFAILHARPERPA